MDKIKLYKISDFKIGRTVNGFYLCIEKNLKHTINGDQFLDIRLKDSSGDINAKLWNNLNVFDARFIAGDIVAVKGTILEFRNINFLDVLSIKKAEKKMLIEYDFNYEELISTNPSNDKIWKKILLLIDDINDKSIKNLIINIYRKNKIRLYNLSKTYDKKGFSEYYLDHLVSVFEVVIKLKKKYNNINFDLVYAICMLQGIGIIKEVPKNNHFNIHFLSWEIVRSEILLNKKFPERTMYKLKDIITNFNSEEHIKLIKSKEALFSYYICNLDQKMNYYNKFIVNDIFNMNK